MHTYDAVANSILEFTNDRNWASFHTVKNLVLALVGEVGELAEIVQWKTDAEVADLNRSDEGKSRLEEELADVFIYMVRIAQVTEINLLQAVEEKIALNQEKYPVDLSFGNATKYNERKR